MQIEINVTGACYTPDLTSTIVEFDLHNVLERSGSRPCRP